ncbi:MAG: ATP-binding protein [Vicinamibacteraceae bacterium]
MTAVPCPLLENRPFFASWLDRLAAVARSLMGGPAGADRPTRSVDPLVDAQLRHAQKLALAGRLATGLVHDLNNALLIAVASLDLMVETPDQAGLVKDQAQAASDALRRAADLTRRVASFGRPDDGTQQQADLVGIVRASARLTEPALRPFIELSVCCPAHPLPVRVDAGQIEQAIVNLCLNARDAMPDGGTLHITARSAIRWVARGDGRRGRVPVTYAVVEVSDTGTGIPRHLQAQVFEPFFTTKAPGQGSGLGLSMVRETAVAHDGLVEMTSDALGTAFRPAAAVLTVRPASGDQRCGQPGRTTPSTMIAGTGITSSAAAQVARAFWVNARCHSQ